MLEALHGGAMIAIALYILLQERRSAHHRRSGMHRHAVEINRKPLSDRKFALEIVRVKRALKLKKASQNNFIVKPRKPFILSANISASELDQIRDGTILPFYEAFCHKFSIRTPTQAIKVFLFRDRDTYNEYGRRLLGCEPTGAAGVCTGDGRVLVNMSINRELSNDVMTDDLVMTTLIHELTHALTGLDFPLCPSWFSEGLAYLSGSWTVTSGGLKLNRSSNLQFACWAEWVRGKEFPDLRRLLSASPDNSDTGKDGSYCIGAESFCTYVEELGLLERFYKSLRANWDRDPTGANTIEKLFGSTLEEIQERWMNWVTTVAQKAEEHRRQVLEQLTQRFRKPTEKCERIPDGVVHGIANRTEEAGWRFRITEDGLVALTKRRVDKIPKPERWIMQILSEHDEKNPGAYLAVSELRRKTGLPNDRFRRAILELEKRRQVEGLRTSAWDAG